MQGDLGPLAAVAALVFVGTDVDNLLTLSGQLAASPERVRRITAGHVVGFVVVVVAAVAVAGALYEVPTRWIGLLGLVPISIGVRGLWAWRRHRDQPRPVGLARRWPTAAGVTTAALVTVGMGGDNLAAYIALFRGAGLAGHAVVLGVLMVAEILLLAGARILGRQPRARAEAERVGVAVAPFLSIVVGVAVIWWAGTFVGR
jgi:cadmium resistance protein CadD (predicted permease)